MSKLVLKITKFFLFLSIIAIAFISCKEDKSKKALTKDAKEVTDKTNAVTYKVTDSKLTWKGYKPSGTHDGTFDLKAGFLKFDGKQLTGGKFVFDMTSIKVLDIKDAKYNADLTGHLTGEDFFNTKEFPTGVFEITSVKLEDAISVIEGNLFLKGITKSVIFPASVIEKNGKITFLSNAIKIDRTEFGIKYKSNKFFDNLKDKFINDLFDITFEITAEKS